MQPLKDKDMAFRFSGAAESPARFRALIRRFPMLVNKLEAQGGVDEALSFQNGYLPQQPLFDRQQPKPSYRISRTAFQEKHPVV